MDRKSLLCRAQQACSLHTVNLPGRRRGIRREGRRTGTLKDPTASLWSFPTDVDVKQRWSKRYDEMCTRHDLAELLKECADIER